MINNIRLAIAAFALIFISATQAPVQAQVLESYTAYIGQNDLFNSRGNRLYEPWQIIRQDRANYHRFRIRDNGDQGDAFFASVANRGRMEQLIRSGHIDPGAARQIVGGNVWVQVDIYQNSVNVTVQ